MNGLLKDIHEINHGKSGNRFKNFVSIVFQIVYKKAKAVGSYIDLPNEIKAKNACVNIKNEDDACIKWCFLAFKHRDEVPSKSYKNITNGYKKWESEFLEPKNLEYPINIQREIPRIEKLNNIKINVFGYENKKAFVIYNSNKKVEKTQILDLLLIEKDGKSHFVWINNFSRFVCSSKLRHKKYVCRNCLNFQTLNKDKLDEHSKSCIKNEAVRIELPTKENKDLKFKNFNRTFPHPFLLHMILNPYYVKLLMVKVVKQ